MLRLTLILCAGMYAALMIAGEDRGQMRPGLAEAAAKAAIAADSVEPAPQPEETVVVAAEPLAEPTVATPAIAEPEATVVARAEPEPYVEPVREVVTEVEEPVFSLSALGNEAVPAAPEPAPEVAADGAGTIWYVVADSVNVRAEPSTEAEVLGKLASGEATLLVQAVNDEWARIVIQGDGVEGFVARRYLSPEAP